MWTKEEIIAGNGDLVKEVHSVEINHSPSVMDISNDSSLILTTVMYLQLPMVLEQTTLYQIWKAIDDGDEPMTYSFVATMLANIGLTLEIEIPALLATCLLHVRVSPSCTPVESGWTPAKGT
jgi:hypothetical protein